MHEYPRILYLGTPGISSFVLEGLISAGYNVVGVLAQPDKEVGRKRILEEVPTKKVALKHNIPVFQPAKVRLDYQFAQELQPDLIICFAYGQIIPQGLLDIPHLGALNLHGSLLPQYRGASPMQMALINDDKVTGITLMQMIDKMDAGLMYAKKEITIDDKDNFTSLAEKMKVAALHLLLESLPLYLDEKLPGIAQNEDEVTFAGLIKREQEHLDIRQPKSKIIGWVRALSEEPGAYLLWEDQIIKMLEVEAINDQVEAPIGTIIQANKNGLFIQVSDGQLEIKRLQMAGKRPMTSKEFVNGRQGLEGEIWL